MADQKLSQLAAIIAANVANEDKVYLLDVSAGVNGDKSVTIQELKNVFLANNSVTDSIVGSRTANDTLATPANTGTLTQLLGWIAGRIKAISGEDDWKTTPAVSLKNIARLPLSASGKTTYFFDDYLSNNFQRGAWMGGTNSGTSAGFFVGVPTQNHQGIVDLRSGITNPGWAGVQSEKCFAFGTQSFVLEHIILLPGTLPNTGADYRINVGFFENAGATFGGTDALMFSMDSLGNGNGRWFTRSRNNNSDAGGYFNISSPAIPSTWYSLKIEVNSSGTEAKFYIGSEYAESYVLVDTITANIPVGRSLRAGAVIHSLGVTNTLQIDKTFLTVQRQ